MGPAQGDIAIITQARMGSTRLPGKILKKVCDVPLLEFHIKRLQRSKLAKEVIVATTNELQDDVIVNYCEENNIKFFRGSEEDVLSRFHETAKLTTCPFIARVTSDCPLIDPDIIDEVFYYFFTGQFDYVSNTLELSFPRGMDVEVFSKELLEQAFNAATESYEREHVTPWIRENLSLNKSNYKNSKGDQSQYRLTVDTEEDFQVIASVLETLHPEFPYQFNLQQIVTYLEQNPEVAMLNSHVKQKSIK